MSADVGRLQGWVHDLDRAGSCAHPIRLVVSRGGRGEDEVLLVACKDRRSAICPACSHTYKGDAWQVVATGLRGGKGVVPDVARHPRVFLTLTAPSFGAVHTRTRSGRGKHLCHPRPSPPCVHGRPMSCSVSHGPDDPALGQALCLDCFDYVGAVLWNAHVAVLWRNTVKRLGRELCRRSEGGSAVRLSYLKAAEFQRRGLVHLHVVLRIDGHGGPEDAPSVSLSTADVVGAAQVVAPSCRAPWPYAVPRPGGSIRWGAQMAATELASGLPEEDDRQMAVAAYVAKYATKTADVAGVLARRVRAASEIDQLPITDHQRRLVETAWKLGAHPGLSDLGLRRCAHAFGYRGHVVTKSRLYSTTFSALRSARADYRRKTGADLAAEGVPVRFGYAGRGYDDPDTGLLAFHLARLATELGGGHET